jgi:hypothetical protein
MNDRIENGSRRAPPGCRARYAEMEDRWLRCAEDLLVWILILDRLLAV